MGGRFIDTSLTPDERGSTALAFPLWVYYSALPAGGMLMAIRYSIRLYRYLFRFGPKTMTVGHIPSHELPTNIITPSLRRYGSESDFVGRRYRMLTLLFPILFFGLLAAGMPIFLVLGARAAVLYVISGEPLIGAAQVIIDHLNSSTLMSLPLFVMAAGFMRQGGEAKALVDVSAAWLGGIRGCLGLVTVVACSLFAAIGGSSVATALSMGTILLPQCSKKAIRVPSRPG